MSDDTNDDPCQRWRIEAWWVSSRGVHHTVHTISGICAFSDAMQAAMAWALTRSCGALQRLEVRRYAQPALRDADLAAWHRERNRVDRGAE